MKDMTNKMMGNVSKNQGKFNDQEMRKVHLRLRELPSTLKKILNKRSATVSPTEGFLVFAAYAEMLVLFKAHVFTERYVFNGLVKDYWAVITHYNYTFRNNFSNYHDRALEYLNLLEPSQEVLVRLQSWLYCMEKAEISEKISQKNRQYYCDVLEAVDGRFQEIYDHLHALGGCQETLQKVNWVKGMALPHRPLQAKKQAKFEDLIADLVKNEPIITAMYDTLTVEQEYALGECLLQQYEVMSDQESEFIRTSRHYSFALVKYMHHAELSLFQIYANESYHESSYIRESLSEVIDDLMVDGFSEATPDDLRRYLIEDHSLDQKLSRYILTHSYCYENIFSELDSMQMNDDAIAICRIPLFRQAVFKKNSDISDWFCSLVMPDVEAVTSLQALIDNRRNFYQTSLSQ